MTQLVITSGLKSAEPLHPTATRKTVAPPREIRLRRALKKLEVIWPDGLHSRLGSLLLRKSCACSTCTRNKRQGLLTLIDADIGIDNLEVTGVSGVQLFFSDGHCRGLYPWGYLRQLCEQTTLANHVN